MIQGERFAAGMKRQLARFDAALAAGMPRRGWKVAINVPEVLEALDLPHSGVGWLDGNAVLKSGDVFVAPPDASLMIEPEVAIFVSQDVGPGASLDQARAAIGGIAPALEIVNYAGASGGPPDFDRVVEHCMFHAATVLGESAPLSRAEGLGESWPRLRLEEGPQAEATRPELVPQDLGELVRFVAAYLAEFGAKLEAGDLIMSGSYTAKALPVAAGQIAIADHGPLGGVRVEVRGAEA